MRLGKLRHVFLTELRTQTVGGLPGACVYSLVTPSGTRCLTDGAMAAFLATGMILTVSDTGKKGIKVFGPKGTHDYIHATRHFLFRCVAFLYSQTLGRCR